MAGSLRTFTDAEIELLKQLVSTVENSAKNPANRTGIDPLGINEDHQAPETYIAYPQTADGIPAMSGTTPGTAVCDIYRVIDNAGTKILNKVSGTTHVVYNTSTAAISQEYITVQRDKFGTWLALVGGSQFYRVRFTVVSANCALLRVVGAITQRPCGVTTVPGEVGGLITIFDNDGCFFNEPNPDLVGRKGWASYMNPEDPTTGTGDNLCVGTGTSCDCEWVVDQLCCLKNECTIGTGT